MPVPRSTDSAAKGFVSAGQRFTGNQGIALTTLSGQAGSLLAVGTGHLYVVGGGGFVEIPVRSSIWRHRALEGGVQCILDVRTGTMGAGGAD